MWWSAFLSNLLVSRSRDCGVRVVIYVGMLCRWDVILWYSNSLCNFRLVVNLSHPSSVRSLSDGVLKSVPVVSLAALF